MVSGARKKDTFIINPRKILKISIRNDDVQHHIFYHVVLLKDFPLILHRGVFCVNAH